MNPLYFMGWRRAATATATATAGTTPKPGVRRVRGVKKQGAR
ncbi:hypothetical protein [Methylibium rhizosphaerae]|nr:hypothetical protein [Methylibium rhizosphaerae]